MQVGDGEEGGKIGEAQAVSCVDLDLFLMSLFGRLNQAVQFVRSILCSGIGKTARMQLNDGGLKGSGRFDLFGIRIDEEAGQNSFFPKLLQNREQG